MATTTAITSDGTQFTKRVLIIVQNQPVPFDRRVWQEATELVKHGYTVSVISPKGRGHEASHEKIDGVNVFRHPQHFDANTAFGRAFDCTVGLLWEMMLAGQVFFTVGFDAIHACNPPDTIFLVGGFFKGFFNRKFLFDHHNTNPALSEARPGRRGVMHKISLWLEYMTFEMADITVVANESGRRIATERGKVAPEKIFVVRSGPDLERIRSVPPVPALKAGRNYLVGYVGIMDKQESIQYLIEAVRIIVHDMKRDDVHFTLVGDGPALADNRKLVSLVGVAEYVTFTGFVPDGELLEILSTADICVNAGAVDAASEISTASKIMEYMALAKPIVQFDAAEDRFSAGDASAYAMPNDAADFAEKIVALLADPARREAMGKTGRARIENELSWPHEAPRLLAAYDALFAEKKKEKKKKDKD